MKKQKKKGLEFEERREIMEMFKSNNKKLQDEAKLRILDALEDFVYCKIHKHFPGHKNMLEDLAQSGRKAILEHMRDYDPRYALTTFFDYHIQNEMQALVNNENNLSHYYAQSAVMITKKIRMLQMDLENIDKNLLAEEMGMSVSQLSRILQNTLQRKNVSLSDCDLEREAGHMQHPEALYINKEENDIIRECIDALDESEKIVLCMYYGIKYPSLNEDEKTFKLSEIKTTLNAAGYDVNVINELRNARGHLRELLKYAQIIK